MINCILDAIESICKKLKMPCVDADDALKCAEAVVCLTASAILLPDEDKTAAAEDKPAAPTEGGKLPKFGERFTYKGIEYIALGKDQGRVYAYVANDDPFKGEKQFCLFSPKHFE